MPSAWIIGVGSTVFGRQPTLTHRDLATQVITSTLADAALASAATIGSVWFASVMSDYWGQALQRGQATLLPLLRSGVLPSRVPITNVEAACASGSVAFHNAVKDVLSGEAEASLAVGVEKLFDPRDRERILKWFQLGEAPFDLEDIISSYRAVSAKHGLSFAPRSDRSLPMDTYSVQAQLHMKRYGTTLKQLALVASKNRLHASMNPKAHHQVGITPAEVLSDKPIAGPLTRAMCAPMTDGASAVLVVSSDALNRCSAETRANAIRVRAVASSGGKYSAPYEPSLTRYAADLAYERAGLGPSDIDLAEVHDATAYCEIYQSEMLGFCDIGEGGPLVESGASQLGGRRPINVSGGLVGKGHPIAATGLSMIGELVTQLRGKAASRQVEGARLALHQNGGGIMGFEEALCVVSILEQPQRRV